MTKSSICEEQIFQEVHKNHGTALRNFLFYKFGDLEKARDFAQDTFVRLWNNCGKVPFEKARSYLFTIANRLFLDEMAHQKVVLKFQYRQNLTETQLENNPEYLYREEEFKAQLEAAVSSLSEKQRAVFLLSRIDKMSNKEIADTLDLSIKTVEKHITSSLKSLREKLDDIRNLRI